MGMPHNRSNLTTKTPYLEPDAGNTPAETKTEPTKKAASNKGKSKKPASETKVKVFVIDTSVLLHDHNAIKSVEDNRVAIPITVLEELDTFKVGNDTKNFGYQSLLYPHLLSAVLTPIHIRQRFFSFSFFLESPHLCTIKTI